MRSLPGKRMRERILKPLRTLRTLVKGSEAMPVHLMKDGVMAAYMMLAP